MFLIYENNKKIVGACRSFVLFLDYAAMSPFTYFKGKTTNQKILIPSVSQISMVTIRIKSSLVHHNAN